MAVCIDGDQAIPIPHDPYDLHIVIDFSKSAFFVRALDEVAQVVGDMITGA